MRINELTKDLLKGRLFVIPSRYYKRFIEHMEFLGIDEIKEVSDRLFYLEETKTELFLFSCIKYPCVIQAIDRNTGSREELYG